MNKLTIALASAALALSFAGCASNASSPQMPQTMHSNATTPANEIPAAFRCLPSGLPKNAMQPALAYMANCAVSDARKHDALQSMAVAMVQDTGTQYKEYCTGTPISYDAQSRIGFIVTAAHCVVGNPKPAGAQVRPRNITTFAENLDRVVQTTPGIVKRAAELTGQIEAVYIPSQYCQAARFNADGCTNLSKQNGDVAVLKVLVDKGQTLAVLPDLQLAQPSLRIASGNEIMALGYGTNTSSTPGDRVLYYITYQYFADGSYQGQSGEETIFNGYRKNGGYYSIICQGDSGGGDFYWDGTHWNLIGAHSYGPNPCGVHNVKYAKAYDASADIRPWALWIQKIVYFDAKASGCYDLGSDYVCRARS